MITCSAFCGLYITDNLSFKTFFQEMNASLKVIGCIFVVFICNNVLIITMLNDHQCIFLCSWPMTVLGSKTYFIK